MTSQDKIKAILMAAVILGVFILCGLGVYRGEMSVTAALATSLAALTSAGVLGALGVKEAGAEE
jgi:hypothetical protein